MRVRPHKTQQKYFIYSYIPLFIERLAVIMYFNIPDILYFVNTTTILNIRTIIE
jgi:hypothetical protein